MDRDFVEMLSALSAARAEFLVVGAHALSVHGHPRATGDLDIWIRPTKENAGQVWKALTEFGAPLDQLDVDGLSTPGLIFQIGVAPHRIDILTSIDGVTFDEAWPNRVTTEIEGVEFGVLGRRELIRNKEVVGRPQDLADVDRLNRLD